MSKPTLEQLTIEEKARINLILLRGHLMYIPWVDKQTELFLSWKPHRNVPVKDIDFSFIRNEGERKAYVDLRLKLESKGHPTRFPFLTSDERYAEALAGLLITQHKRGIAGRGQLANFYPLSAEDAEGFLRFYPKND